MPGFLVWEILINKKFQIHTTEAATKLFSVFLNMKNSQLCLIFIIMFKQAANKGKGLLTPKAYVLE